jgi:hypothetical protein
VPCGKQRTNEELRLRHRCAKHGFPYEHAVGSAVRNHARSANAQRVAEGRERRRAVLVQIGQDVGVRREVAQRLVVQCGQPERKQRGAPVGEDLREELSGRYRPAEDGVAPQLRAQRHRDRLRRELDPHRLAAVQLGGELGDVDAEIREQLDAFDRALLVGHDDLEHPVLIAQLQSDKIEKVPQPAALALHGRHRQRDDNRVDLQRLQRRLEPLDHLAVRREPCELGVDVYVLSFLSVVDDLHQLAEEARAIGHHIDAERARGGRRAADDRDVFAEPLGHGRRSRRQRQRSNRDRVSKEEGAHRGNSVHCIAKFTMTVMMTDTATPFTIDGVYSHWRTASMAA